jgi:uncharacterized membrane protein
VAELVVIAFDDSSAADNLMAEISTLEKQYIVQLQDAAVITRAADGRYHVKQAVDIVGAGALGGAFWGLLVGFLFLMPFVGAAIGAASGALSGAFADMGIDQRFIEMLSGKLPPGKSAVVLIVEKATPDKVLEAIAGYGGTIVQSSLTADAQAKLQVALNRPPSVISPPSVIASNAAAGAATEPAAVADSAPNLDSAPVPSRTSANA